MESAQKVAAFTSVRCLNNFNNNAYFSSFRKPVYDIRCPVCANDVPSRQKSSLPREAICEINIYTLKNVSE